VGKLKHRGAGGLGSPRLASESSHWPWACCSALDKAPPFSEHVGASASSKIQVGKGTLGYCVGPQREVNRGCCH
jgi:hypothetical protein